MSDLVLSEFVMCILTVSPLLNEHIRSPDSSKSDVDSAWLCQFCTSENTGIPQMQIVPDLGIEACLRRKVLDILHQSSQLHEFGLAGQILQELRFGVLLQASAEMCKRQSDSSRLSWRRRPCS